jgi:hypothetical protein
VTGEPAAGVVAINLLSLGYIVGTAWAVNAGLSRSAPSPRTRTVLLVSGLGALGSSVVTLAVAAGPEPLPAPIAVATTCVALLCATAGLAVSR